MKTTPNDTLKRIAASPVIIIAIVLVFVAGCGAMAYVRLPHADEGQFAGIAWEFAHNHRLAAPMWTEWVPSLDRYLYVTVPLYFIQLGEWSHLSGFEISALRMNSVAWGVVLILSWFFIVEGLTCDRLLAVLALILVAVNYDVMDLSSGRYDPMAAALSAAGTACYVVWRKRNLMCAVLLSNTFIAAACMTHPLGVFGMIAFTVLFLMLDLRRFSWKLLVAAGVPYAVALGAWGLYIAQNPAEFQRQMAANVSGRLTAFHNPVWAFVTEFQLRYLEKFAGFRDDVPGLMKVKILVLLAYIFGFAGCLLARRIREDRAKLALVTIGLAFAFALTFLEGTREYNYLIHVLPSYSVVLAIWVHDLSRRGGLGQKAAIASVVLFCTFAIATVAFRLRVDDYHHIYVPTKEFLAKNVRDDELVMATGEFGPGLGFRRHCLDDSTFGYYNKLKPTYIVVSPQTQRKFDIYREKRPAVYAHIREVLTRSDQVFERSHGSNYYRVYRVTNDLQSKQ